MRNTTIWASHVSPAHEFAYAALARQLRVAEDYAADVDGEIAVAVQAGGDGECEEYRGEDEYGYHRRGPGLHLLGACVVADLAVERYEPVGDPAHAPAGQTAHAELQQQLQGEFAGRQMASERYGFDQDHGEHVGHRVVGAAFEFEHRL